MSALNENHKRRLTVAFKYADDLLSRSLEAAAPQRPSLYPRYVEDISPSTHDHLEQQVEKIREQMRGLLEKWGIETPPPSKPSSWVVKTNLTMLDVGLEDLFPEKLRGYGEMEKAAAKELTVTLHEMRRQLGQLLAYMAEAHESSEKHAPHDRAKKQAL
jgi:hypothetical protein